MEKLYRTQQTLPKNSQKLKIPSKLTARLSSLFVPNIYFFKFKTFVNLYQMRHCVAVIQFLRLIFRYPVDS